jgi:hypothetical protein
MTKRPCHGGAEYDAFTGWRRVNSWRARERAAIKRRANRRDRRQAKRELVHGAVDQ